MRMIDIRGMDGGVYTRASEDRAAGSRLEGISVAGQEDDAAERAEELGVNLVETYCDNNISASKYSTKQRKGWARMLHDLEAGRFKVLFMWENSRGSRKLREWAEFLDLVEEKKILIHVISHNRTYDPTNQHDWEALASDGVKSASESNRTSSRVRRGVKKARKLGRPLGMPPFGWMSEYDPKTGKMITWAPVGREQAVVREMYERVLSGDAILTLTRDLARRCDLPESDPAWVPRTKRGKRWQAASVRTLLLSPTHIGKYYVKSPEGRRELTQGAWGAAIDEDLWWRVHQILTDPERKMTRPGRSKHLLTNIARCSVCRSVMGASGSGSGHAVMRCLGYNEDGSPGPGGGHVSVKIEWIEDHVRDELVRRLCDRKLVSDLSAASTGEQASAQAKAAELRAELTANLALVRPGGLTVAEYLAIKEEYEPEIARLNEIGSAGMETGAIIAVELLREADAAGVLEEDLPGVMRDAIEETPIPGQRALVRALTKSITIRPGRRGARSLDPDRVEIL
jgi:DNA invertase Pin-like site-specific DNA recombinase